MEAHIKVCMVAVPNCGSAQVSITPKENAPTPPSFRKARSAREIDNFIWELEAYFEAMGIENDAQKVSNIAFSLRDITLVWWRHRFDDVRR